MAQSRYSGSGKNAYKAFKQSPMVQKLKTQPETMSELTERAIRASVDIIPPTVFVPLNLRRSRKRIFKNRVVKKPPTEEEIADDIAKAAPHKFLIAIMNGQPIPSFTITEFEKSLRIDVKFVLPTMEDRLQAAIALQGPRKAPARPDGFRDLIAEKARKFDDVEEDH